MCSDAGVGDQNLVSRELTEGFKLTGRMCESGQFPKKLRPAAITVKQLKESAVWAKRMIYASCKRVASDPEIAEAVYQETMQQLQDGWVQGPFSMQQMDDRHNGCWIPEKADVKQVPTGYGHGRNAIAQDLTMQWSTLGGFMQDLSPPGDR